MKDFRENSIKGPQQVDRARYSKVVTLHRVEGWDATILWEGVKVKDLLAQAGYDPKAALVIFTAYDGYTTSLPLQYLVERDILLAFKMNDAEMIPERGFPFALVAEDKWGYKWIKWVTRMEVSNDASFRGYWEQRGYNQNGDLGGPQF